MTGTLGPTFNNGTSSSSSSLDPHKQYSAQSRNAMTSHFSSSSGKGGSNAKGNSSDPPRSFLALDGDSSPSIHGSESGFSAPLYSSVPSPAGPSRLQDDSPRQRLDTDSSFLSTTSPLLPRTVNGLAVHSPWDYDGQHQEAERPARNTRGSRLGAQMGRTRSAQHDTSADTSFDNTISSLGSPGGLHSLTSPSRRAVTPSDDGRVSGGRTVPISTHLMADPRYLPSRSEEEEMRGSSLSIASRWEDAEEPAEEPTYDAMTGQTLPNISKNQYRGISDEAKSPISQPFAYGDDTFANADLRSAALASVQQPRVASREERSIWRKYSTDDLRSSASASPAQTTSPERGVIGLPRVGRLSRLQYNKADNISTQSGPAWNLSGRGTNRTSILGRSSNSNLLQDYKNEESSRDGQRMHSSRQSSVSSNARDHPSSANEEHAFDESVGKIERRELILPALQEKKQGGQTQAVMTAEALRRRTDRKRSSYMKTSDRPGDDGDGVSNDRNIDHTYHGQPSTLTAATNQLSPPSNMQEWHRRTPSMETASPAMTEDTWQGLSESTLGKKKTQVDYYDPTGRNDSSFSSSPTHGSTSAMAAAASRSQGERRSVRRRSRLTDAEIMRLGALPGAEGASPQLSVPTQPLTSKNILNIALQKAQSAVQLDSANNVPEAIQAYRQAVRLLEEVSERVSPSNVANERRKTSRENERRRLKVIHDTYAERIRLLSMINAPDEDSGEASGSGHNSSARESEEQADRSLEGLGIAQGGVTLPSAPQIAVTDEPGLDERRNKQQGMQRYSMEAKELLRDEANRLQRHPSSVLPSDSENSFSSAVLAPGSKAAVVGSLQPPSQDRFRSPQATLTSAGEEEIRSPATPYFDIDPSLVGAVDNAAFASNTSSPRPVFDADIPSPQLSHETRRSRSPQDRQQRGISSLDNIPSAKAIAATAAVPSSRRFLSVGSHAQFQQGASPKLSDSTDRKTITASAPATDPVPAVGHAEDTLGVRPRALTMEAGAQQQRPLVSSSVSSGTISQRRKAAGAVDTTDQSALTHSPSSTDAETVRGGRTAGGTENREGGRAASIASSAGRKRAISQPNHRRPTIPATFLLHNQPPPGSLNGPPPLPKITRKSSMPLSPFVFANTGAPAHGAQTRHATGFRFPSPAPSASSGYHALGTPSTPFAFTWSGMLLGGGVNAGEGKAALVSDLFPSLLPSMQMGIAPSFTSNSQVHTLPWMGINGPLPDNLPVTPPSQPSLRPFHTMKLLQASMEKGHYITKRLHLTRELWLQSGTRLLAIETKVRMVDTISNGIDGLQHVGHFLLYNNGHTDQPGLNAINASKFLKALEEFETLLIEVQNTLAKKLGFLETARGKKSGNSSLGAFGSKLSRSLAGMTATSKHLESPATYVEGLSRLFLRSQVLGDHLSTLLRSKVNGNLASTVPNVAGGGGGGGHIDDFSPKLGRGGDPSWERISVDSYATLPSELKRAIEAKLKRTSDFFANVILRFVLRDVDILLDKSVKRGTALLTE